VVASPADSRNQHRLRVGLHPPRSQRLRRGLGPVRRHAAPRRRCAVRRCLLRLSARAHVPRLDRLRAGPPRHHSHANPLRGLQRGALRRILFPGPALPPQPLRTAGRTAAGPGRPQGPSRALPLRVPLSRLQRAGPARLRGTPANGRLALDVGGWGLRRYRALLPAHARLRGERRRGSRRGARRPRLAALAARLGMVRPGARSRRRPRRRLVRPRRRARDAVARGGRPADHHDGSPEHGDPGNDPSGVLDTPQDQQALHRGAVSRVGDSWWSSGVPSSSSARWADPTSATWNPRFRPCASCSHISRAGCRRGSVGVRGAPGGQDGW